LPASKFCRIHRSYIVSLDNITSFNHNKVFIGEKPFPIGASYNKELQKHITLVTNEWRDSRKVRGSRNILSEIVNSQN
jgi:LytTr DNA-binding domain